MRECGAWVREARHWQHLIAIAELVETRILSSWMSKRRQREDVDELRHKRQHNVIDPQHEKLVEEIVEVVQIISQKHLSVQCNCLTVTFSSVRVAPRE